MRWVGLFAVVLAVAVGVGAAAAAPPRWQAARGASAENEAVLWIGNRLAFLSRSRSDRYIVRSAPVANGRLGRMKSAQPALGAGNWLYLTTFGDDLVFATSPPTADAPLRAVRLLPNGTLTAPVDLGGAQPQPSSTGSPVIQLRDRAVQLVSIGATRPGACCDLAGKPADFSSFIRPGSAPIAKLGVDRRGRVWLVWTPGRQGKRQQAAIVELDPATLKPRGAPTPLPGFDRGFVTVHALVCTDACRLVAEGLSGRGRKTVSWAPGERAPIQIRLPAPRACVGYNCGAALDARVQNGRLVVASWAQKSELALTINVARGDTRGTRLKRIDSIDLPTRLGAFERGMILTSRPFGAFGVRGFAPVAVYTGGGRPVVRVAFLRS